jgi:pimeloyl-ACP methyl ester carboxylesterase
VNLAVGLIIVGVCAVLVISFPLLMRLRDRRKERRQGLRKRTSIADGAKREGVRSLDGTPLYVDYIGDSDPTVFLVHGILGSGQVFRYQKPWFSRKYRVVSLDLRGHGRSGVPASGDYSIDRLAEDVKAAVDEFDPETFVVAGHSMGGFTTFKFFERFGQEYEGRLKGLAILDSTGIDTTGMSLRWKLDGLYLSLLMDLKITELLKKPFANSAFMYVHGKWLSFSRKAPASEVEFVQGIGACVPIKAMKGCAKACGEHKFEYYLPNVDVPVLLLVGDDDSLMARDRMNSRTYELLPDARLKVVPEAGHNAMLEKPDAVNLCLDAFFTECFSGAMRTADEEPLLPGFDSGTEQVMTDAR